MPRKKKYEDRPCVICSKVYSTEISNKRGRERKTCGDRKCQDKLRLQTTYEKNCVICGTEYVSVRKNSKFCSEECRRKRHEITCLICKNKFRADRPEIRFCSQECESTYKKSNISMVNCDYCNSPIERTANHIFKTKNNFCDSTCCNNFWAYKLFSGKSKYGGDWGTIRKNTISFYDYRCQKCYADITLRTCNIHHIVPIHYFNDKEKHIANSIENLIPLCIECHKEVHLMNNKWYEENFKVGEFLKI